MWLDDCVLTERLCLRAPRESDKDALIRLLTDSRVRRYLGGPVDEDTARDALLGALDDHRWGVFIPVRKDTGDVVGSCQLDRERGELEISYQLLPEFWGHGYATEAVVAVLRWAASANDDPHIIAVTQTANEPSCRLLQRLGMRRSETFEEYGVEQAKYRLDGPDWRAGLGEPCGPGLRTNLAE
ncbi:MAG: GNAT family N-acetyltransferase [Actinomycetota bacterium]|nr:GNAT family N-acetyltransferase [Actinomycetota bacterium]